MKKIIAFSCKASNAGVVNTVNNFCTNCNFEASASEVEDITAGTVIRVESLYETQCIELVTFILTNFDVGYMFYGDKPLVG